MTPNQAAFVAAVFAVACVVVGRRHRNRWIGGPFYALAALVMIEVAPSPWLQRDDAGRELEFPVRVARTEVLGHAMSVQLGIYAALACGLLVASALGRGRPTEGSYRAPATVCKRAVTPALAVTAVGALCVLIVLAFLLPSGVGALAKREAFVNEDATSSGLYGWAFSFAPLLFTGGLALIALSRPLDGPVRLGRQRIGVTAAVAYVGYQALIGGRGRVIFAVAAVALVVHHSGRRIRIRHGVLIAAALIAALGYISAARFDGSSGLAGVPGQVLANKRIHDVAYMVEAVPGDIDRAGLGTITAGLSHTVPVVAIPGTVNPSDYVSVELLGVSIYRGNAATNYATAAELYLSVTYPIALLVAIGYGLFFGLVLDLCGRRRSPFTLLVAVFAAVAFWQGASARMPSQLGAFLTLAFLPAAAIAASAQRHRAARDTLIYATVTAVFASEAFAAMGLGILAWAARGAAAVLLVSAYVGAVLALRSTDRGRAASAAELVSA